MHRISDTRYKATQCYLHFPLKLALQHNRYPLYSCNPPYIDDDGVARVADELPLRHLVLDVRRGEVDGEQDQREAHHVNRI